MENTITTAETATARQLSYLAYLVKGFKAPDNLSKKEASFLIRKALKDQKQDKAKASKASKASDKGPKPSEPVNKYGVKVGDLFAFSYGYDATFYVIFQVTRIVGVSMVEVAEICKKSVEGNYGPCSWKVAPAVGCFKRESSWYKGEKASKRVSISKYGGEPYICFGNGHHSAYKINENEEFLEDDYN